MSDVEKSLGVQPTAVDNMPNKVELKESSSYDGNSTEKVEDTVEKESVGSMRDYFVSNEREYLCCIGLMLG